jgi:hypothetical protein
MKKTTRFSLFIFLALFSYLFVINVFAAEVTQVKGKNVMIKDISASPGEKFFIVSPAGKRIGIVVIKQAKGGKAIGEVTKGRAEIGASVSKGGSTASSSGGGGSDSSGSSSSGSSGKSKMGILWSYGSHSFAMDIAETATSSNRVNSKLAGSSFLNLKGFYDYPLSNSLNIRAAVGIESFDAKSTLANANKFCDKTNSCSVSYTYLALEGMGQFNYLNSGGSRGWIGLGYSFLVAMQKKKNIANLEDSSTNQMVLFSTGYDIGLSGGAIMPIAIDYGLFPGSSDVKVSSMYLRLGYGW